MQKIKQIVEEFRETAHSGCDYCFGGSSGCKGKIKDANFLTQSLTTQQEEFKKMVEEEKQDFLDHTRMTLEVVVSRTRVEMMFDDLLTKLNQE